MFGTDIIMLFNMKLQNYLAVVLIMVMLNVDAKAQNRILMLDGKTVITQDYTIDTSGAFAELKYLNPRGKVRYIDYADVFSIENKSSDKSFVVYKPVSSDELSVEQMKFYVNGRLAGRNTGYPWFQFGVNYLAGASSGLYSKNRIFIAPLLTVATSITFSLDYFDRFAKRPVNYPQDSNEYFENGYNDQRRQKRIKASITGALSGLATGGLIYALRNLN